MKFGFLGLGIMGSGIVKNLLNSGHKVLVWNRTAAKVSHRFILLIPLGIYKTRNITISFSTNRIEYLFLSVI